MMEFALLLAQATSSGSSLAAPFFNYGVIGVCLIALSIYYIRKDQKYEKRIDEMLKREKEFQEETASLAEKYRLTMERFAQTLEVVVGLLKSQK